ncbi:MAG: inositol phosphorylceramide synthase [Herpetosiphonaceae bacterium]|nr:inositol phosphorylceramide synthase [Herpetosiphonaceae bacterium]
MRQAMRQAALRFTGPRIWLAALQGQWRLVALGVMSFVAYFGPGHIPGLTAHSVPYLAIDRTIPLLPWTIYGYISLYPLLLANLIYLVPHPPALRPLISAIILANLIAGTIFIVYRTQVTRPPLQQTFGWQLLAVIWSIDPPYNALPSLHTAYSVLIAWTHIKLRSRYWPLVLVWCAIVIATTLTTKQHQALDLLGGAGMAALLGWLVLRTLSPADLKCKYIR